MAVRRRRKRGQLVHVQCDGDGRRSGHPPNPAHAAHRLVSRHEQLVADAMAVHQVIVEAHDLAQELGNKAEYADEVVHATVMHVHDDEHLTNLH